MQAVLIHLVAAEPTSSAWGTEEIQFIGLNAPG
jgi:hypothetical protein